MIFDKRNLLIRIMLLPLLAVFLNSCGHSLERKLYGTKRNITPYEEVNADNPGLETNVRNSTVTGKYTIIDFSSEGCPSCREMKPLLQRLTERRPDIVVRTFDVNRQGVDHIDWDSPLVKKYKIHSLPFLMIFNEHATLLAQGDEAKQQIIDAINKSIKEQE